MLNKCRVCLGFSENMKHVTHGDPLATMYTSLTKFEWIRDENIASSLCPECETTLEKCHTFLEKCKKSHAILLKEIEEKSEIKEEENDFDDESESEGKNKSHLEQISVEEVEKAIFEYQERQKGGTYTCIVCNYVLISLRALSGHMSMKHKDVRANWCHICNQTFDNLAEHNHRLLESCPFCEKTIAKKYFVEHLKAHAGIRTIQCCFCTNKFATYSALQWHYSTKHSDEMKNDIATTKRKFCQICNKRVRSLPRHNSQLHEKTSAPKTHICHFCTKELKTESGLKTHLKLHKSDGRHTCSYCGKPHRDRATMIQHERTHTGEKPFICSVCGKGFAQSSGLNTHMKLHTGRPEACHICEKRFCRPSELKLHLRKHAGEKPFLCTECGKAFKQKSHLTEHMNAAHSDVRPFECHYCHKAFKLKSLLTSHLQRHSV
ncbi:oocyte zinc finger protein XlCOF6.1 isoform X2 [Tribolium castaneum]|uniref:oocyte zinc finger protein XlCOF6.1 isoform X2 n=1 Tax=Tribolium castaneum TaxID=7070 RepID=UPI00046C2C58|nr:PREDICTED: oocyte zinc finger protein XlCOF6.1 isoform X2 [Tribolium castaneum]|eukprot:XP_008194898.1 PREDICTED: oocyte zinc finger protein XlCOF6.1 isoform X2 [Tribolium castaneum]